MTLVATPYSISVASSLISIFMSAGIGTLATRNFLMFACKIRASHWQVYLFQYLHLKVPPANMPGQGRYLSKLLGRLRRLFVFSSYTWICDQVFSTYEYKS